MAYIEKKRWVFLGLPWTFTKYTIDEDVITVNTGCFTKAENDCYMYKVQDVELTTTFWERIVKVGTVICYTGDTTSHHLHIQHVRNAKEIKDFILKQSEIERRKRRTMNTVDISAGHVDFDCDVDACDMDADDN